jgi:hypothetical protein
MWDKRHMRHDAAWSEALAVEQADQRALLETLRHEARSAAADIAAALAALDTVGGGGDLASTIARAKEQGREARAVLDVARRVRGLARGAVTPEDADLAEALGTDANVPARLVEHARGVLAREPARTDRELLAAVAEAAGERARLEDVLSPTPLVALDGLRPLAARIPRLSTPELAEARRADDTLTAVLEAAVSAPGAEAAEAGLAADADRALRAAAARLGRASDTVEGSSLGVAVAEAHGRLQADLDALGRVLANASDASEEWLGPKSAALTALEDEVRHKLDRAERVAGWLVELAPRLRLAARGLSAAERLERHGDPGALETAEAARLSLLTGLASVWGALAPVGDAQAAGRRRPGRAAVYVAAALLALAAAGIGGWAVFGRDGADARTGSEISAELPPVTAALYPVNGDLLFRWRNDGASAFVRLEVTPDGFGVRAVSAPCVVAERRIVCELTGPNRVEPGASRSIGIVPVPSGARGDVLAVFADADGTTWNPLRVRLGSPPRGR